MNTFLGIADQCVRILWSQSWQIAILVGLIGGVSLLSRRASANFRYWLWCIVLVRLCFPMNVALPLGMGGEVRQAAETYVQTALVRPEIVPSTNPVGTVQSVQDTSLRAEQSASGIAHVQAGFGVMSFNAKLMIAWGLLSASIASLILLRSIQTYRLLRKCPRINRPELLALIDQLRARYGIRRPLQTVCFCPSLAGRGPAVVGILRPAIILPPQMVEQWTLDEIEPVLLHELAHIKRGDLFINLIQMIVQAIYFFHPLVWYANAQIRRERELVCDDLAVLHSDGRRKRYSQSIMRVIEEIGKDDSMLGVVGMGMAESRSSLAKRIVRLMRQNYKLYKPVGWFSVAVLILLAAVGVALAGERPAGVSDTQKLGEEVSKRVNNFTDSQTFTLKDGESVRMDVKENEAQVSAINITPHIVEEGTRFDIELLNMNGNPTQNGTEHISVIHDGKSDGLNTGLLVGGKPMLCKVRFTPERKGVIVVFEAKVLFTKMLTPEETEAMLAVQGKAGQVKLDFMRLRRALMQYKQQEGHLPESLEPLSQPLPKDVYSNDGVEYHFEILGKGYILSSCGEDGVYGNDDDFILVSGSRSSQSGLRNEIYPLREDENPALQDTGSTVQREHPGPSGRRPKGNASLSGKIIDAATGKPVDHGTIMLMCLASLDSIFIDVPSDGTFKFENIPTGQYNMSAIHVAGYVDTSYNPENKEGKFPPFQLKDNEQRTGVVLSMPRAYSIRGRVSTEEGSVLPKGEIMTVVAWAEKKDASTEGIHYEIAAQMNVNQDDGTYFLNGLDGRPIYVMAMNFRAQERDSAYPPMYFPGTFSRNEATRITFEKEDVIKNIDIRLSKTGGLPMEGTVTDRATGKPIPKALVVVHHKDMLFDRAIAYTDEQGHYRFECLSPGEMLVHVDATPSGYVRTRKSVTMMTSTTIMQMDFTLMTGATLSGKFVDEEGKPWQTHKPYGSAAILGNTYKGSTFSGLPSRYASGGPIQVVTYSLGEGDYKETDMAFPNDNSFVINGMMPGKVLITFNPYTEGQRVTKILHGGKDIGTSGNFEVGSGQTIDDISIVIGPDKKL